MQLSKVTTEVYNFGRILVMGTTSHGHSGKKKKSFFFFWLKNCFISMRKRDIYNFHMAMNFMCHKFEKNLQHE
jgi:hypothetical protein